VFPQETRRLGPKGKGPGIGALQSPIVDSVPGEEAEPNPPLKSGANAERGKPVGLPADIHLLGEASRKACWWVCG
jgi:hypothetical protein